LGARDGPSDSSLVDRLQQNENEQPAANLVRVYMGRVKWEVSHTKEQKMGDKSGLAQPKCYAGELADCGPEMSREHYMTESVLQGIAGSGTTIEVSGLPWLSGTASQTLPTASLKAWVLCEKHNNALAELDAESSNLRKFMDQIHAHFNDGQDEEFLVDGDWLERWMLKTVCGHIASGNMVNQQGESIDGWKPPLQWLEIIFQRQPFPTGCGLYLSRKNAGKCVDISRQLLRVAPLFDRDQKSVIGMRMWLFEVECILAMHESVRYARERLLDDAIYRPGILLYQDPKCQKRLVFQWSGPTQREVFEIRRLPLIGR
jgi:hypothetical protein